MNPPAYPQDRKRYKSIMLYNGWIAYLLPFLLLYWSPWAMLIGCAILGFSGASCVAMTHIEWLRWFVMDNETRKPWL